MGVGVGAGPGQLFLMTGEPLRGNPEENLIFIRAHHRGVSWDM